MTEVSDGTTSGDLAMSIAAFCRSAGISKRTFYALMKRGEAPPTVRIGRRRLVRPATAAVWLQSREAA